MSADVNEQGAEIYKLVERVLRLQNAEFAFAMERERRRQQFDEAERRLADESRRVHDELRAAQQALREKLGVPEPSKTAPSDGEKTGFGSVSDLFEAFGDLFKTPPKCDPFPPAGPVGPSCG